MVIFGNIMSYKDLQTLYNRYFSISTLGNDFSSRLALISLTCYLYDKLKPKNPDLTYFSLLYKIGKSEADEESLKILSIICENFGKNCKEFPDFGIQPNEMPKKIKKILHSWLPF